MPLPALAIAAAVKGGLALAKGVAKGRAAKKKAEADMKAATRLHGVRETQHKGLQARRSSRLGGIQSAIKNVNASLGPGAPDYSYDEAALEGMRAPVAYGETPESLLGQVQGDPRAGLGSSMVAGLADTGSQLASDYIGAKIREQDDLKVDPVQFQPDPPASDLTPEEWERIKAGEYLR